MENNSSYPIIMAVQGEQANANANIPNLRSERGEKMKI